MEEEIAEEKKREIKQWSSFVLDDAFESMKRRKEKLLQLKQDIEDDPDDNQEKIRLYNFMAYLHWRLDEKPQANDAINLAENLENEHPNLITHCNKIIFSIESEDCFQSNKLAADYENETFQQSRVRSRAVAEIAYFHSRLGPKHHEKAVKGFRRAIKDINPERNIAWEYGLALTLRRQSNLMQMLKPQNYKPSECQKEAARLLYGVVKFSTDGYHKTKARAWCELTKIMFYFKCKNLCDIIKTHTEEGEKINPTQCFREALKLCPNEYYVLQSYGRHLRYENELEKAKEILESAMNIRDDPFSRHHLALTLKSMVESENASTLKSENKMQLSSSMKERWQSQEDPVISGKGNISKNNASLPVCSAPNNFQSGPNKQTENISIIYERPKSTGCQDSANSREENTSDGHSSVAVHDNDKISSLTDSIHHEKIFVSMRNSPRYICKSPHNPLLQEAVNHLKKAVEMRMNFDVARYDLGLIYRMLDQPKEALNWFTRITSNNCGKPTEYPITLINAYEQQAICNLEIEETEPSSERKKALTLNARASMWKALTVVSGVIGDVPMLKTTNQCFPTLKTLLENEKQSTKTLKELAQLHEQMGYAKESIQFYEKMDGIKDDPESLKKLSQNYLEVGDFDNAFCTLSLLQNTKGFDEFGKSFYVDAYIKGARDSLGKGNLDMAKLRLLKVYQTLKPIVIQGKEAGENSPDFLILDGCGVEDGCCWIKPIISTLKSFVKLTVVVNHMDCHPGSRITEYLEKTMNDARCIIRILHECDDAKKDEYIQLALDQLALHHRAKTLLIRSKGCNPDFPMCKEIIFPLDQTDFENDNIMQGTLLSKILTKMAEMFIESNK